MAEPLRPLASSPRAVAAVLLGALTFALAAPARALVVDGTRATFAWEPAPGDVVEYGVWIVPEGRRTARSADPDLRVRETRAAIDGETGSSVRVVVAAYYADGIQGPDSEPSESIHFRAPGTISFDLDGSGTTDVVVLDPAAMEHRVLLLARIGASATATLPPVADAQWRVSGSADFDADGFADLLMAHVPSGSAELWLMRGAQVLARHTLASRGRGWYARALGDREPDGRVRVLWHDQASGRSELWLLDGVRPTDSRPLLGMDSMDWEVWASCDVDGNGLRDVIWMDRLEQNPRIWFLEVGGDVVERELEQPGRGLRLVACGPIEDRVGDSVVWQGGGEVVFWRYTESLGDVATGSLRRRRAPPQSQIAQAGDADGDGDADLVMIGSAAADGAGISSLSVWRTRDGDVVERRRHDLGGAGRWGISSW